MRERPRSLGRVFVHVRIVRRHAGAERFVRFSPGERRRIGHLARNSRSLNAPGEEPIPPVCREVPDRKLKTRALRRRLHPVGVGQRRGICRALSRQQRVIYEPRCLPQVRARSVRGIHDSGVIGDADVDIGEQVRAHRVPIELLAVLCQGNENRAGEV